MKRVGLITIYDNMNFGNRLQNYALHHYLENELKCKCLTLVSNYNKRRIGSLKAELAYLLSKTSFRSRVSSDPLTHKYWKFLGFTRKYIPTKHYYGTYSVPSSANSEFDMFIAGSDQIWNPSFPGRFSSFALHAKDYFLEFAEDNKKISYAASIGCDILNEEQEAFFQQRLQHFKHISVRENEGKDIIKALLPTEEVSVHIDPTMLLTKDSWSAVAKAPEHFQTSPYMLEYFLGSGNEYCTKMLAAIRDHGDLTRIDIMDSNDLRYFAIGPAEFLYMIQHAQIVCTDSFHAVVFSILFDKPFVVFPRGNMNSRLQTLLSKLGLTCRMSNQITEEALFFHDYAYAKQVLSSERQLAYAYLYSAIYEGDVK